MDYFIINKRNFY